MQLKQRGFQGRLIQSVTPSQFFSTMGVVNRIYRVWVLTLVAGKRGRIGTEYWRVGIEWVRYGTSRWFRSGVGRDWDVGEGIREKEIDTQNNEEVETTTTTSTEDIGLVAIVLQKKGLDTHTNGRSNFRRKDVDAYTKGMDPLPH